MPAGAWTICLAALLTVDPASTGVRTSRHVDPVIQRALALIGQPLNAIVVVDAARARQMYASTPGAGTLTARVNAFRAPGNQVDSRIYVIGDSAVYRRAARAPAALDLLKLAATLVHEQVHATDADAAAYRLQADFVRSRLRSLPGAQREQGRRYLEALDARAAGLAPERLRLSRERFDHDSPLEDADSSLRVDPRRHQPTADPGIHFRPVRSPSRIGPVRNQPARAALREGVTYTSKPPDSSE